MVLGYRKLLDSHSITPIREIPGIVCALAHVSGTFSWHQLVRRRILDDNDS
jgi:hypothetical protein